MNLLLDTPVLLWAAGSPSKLPVRARAMLEIEEHRLFFSAVNLWEVAIKNSLGRADFKADPHVLRRGLIDNGWEELAITSLHAVEVSHLPPLHRDPFDRMLVAQARSEGVTLLTADKAVAAYGDPVIPLFEAD